MNKKKKMFDYSKLDNPAALETIFHPNRSGPREPIDGAIDIDFQVDENVTICCRFHVAGPDAPTILYFHGNGEQVSDYDVIGPMYVETGMNILITDFRGYGWSSGRPTVSAMFSDSAIILEQTRDWLQQHDFSGPLFIMGRSLGCTCAIDLCQGEKKDIKGLIIESGFCDTLPLMMNLGIHLDEHDISEEECFNNRSKISTVTLPTLILHGSRDSLIPAVEAEKLQANCGARSKEFQLIPGAEHNSMISTGGVYYFRAIRQFIDKVTGASSWRNQRRKKKIEEDRYGKRNR